MDNQKNESVFHDFQQTKNAAFLTPKLIIVLIIVVALGTGTGFILSNKGTSSVVGKSSSGSNPSTSEGSIVGSEEYKNKDKTEGVLKEGGIEGEGQYHLVRPGGDSQNVYLTSSIVDLSKFVGKKIKVWGQTNTAQKAGWLMDVGLVEVLE